jgi:hypothetical protein
VNRLFSVLPTRLVPEEEWRAAGFSPEIFINVNTREEYEAVASTTEETARVLSRGKGL